MREILAIGFSIGGKREKEAFSVLSENTKLVLELVRKFEDFVITFFGERNLKKAEALGREISTMETKADRGRRDFMRTLHEGAFLPAFRGDLARLAEQIDNVADAAEDAAFEILFRDKLIGVIAKAERKIARAKTIRTSLIEMAKLTTKTVDTLYLAVQALMKNVDLAHGTADEIDEFEHEVDLVGQGLMTDIYEFEKALDPVSAVQLVEISRKVENITDRAEDASDMIQIVGYSIRV